MSFVLLCLISRPLTKQYVDGKKTKPGDLVDLSSEGSRVYVLVQ